MAVALAARAPGLATAGAAEREGPGEPVDREGEPADARELALPQSGSLRAFKASVHLAALRQQDAFNWQGFLANAIIQ